MWGAGRRFRGRANYALITGRFYEGRHVCALSHSRNGSMSFLVVPEQMPMCFPLYIVSSLWKVQRSRLLFWLPRLAIPGRGNAYFSLEGFAKGHFRIVAKLLGDRLHLDIVLEQ